MNTHLGNMDISFVLLNISSKFLLHLAEFLSYNIMLNSGKKICALRDKKINILTLVLSEKKNSERNKKP
jgi:hypothetical protein